MLIDSQPMVGRQETPPTSMLEFELALHSTEFVKFSPIYLERILIHEFPY